MSARLKPAAALMALALLGACDTVKRIPAQVGELGSRVGGWFSFGGGDVSIADDPQVIVLPLVGTDWLGRPALAEEIARLLRTTTPNARAGTAPDGRSRTIEGQVEAIEEGDSVVWLEIAWTYRGRDRAPIAEHRQIAAMDRKLWDRASPSAVQMIASEIAPKAAALLRNESPRLIAARAAGSAPNGEAIGLGGEVASNQPAAAYAPPPPVGAPVRESPPPPSGAYAPFAQDPGAYVPTQPPPGAVAAPRPFPQPFPQAAPPPAPPPIPPVREIASAPVAPVQGSPLSSAWANPVILVKVVEGAPGDGNQALMLAIKQALRIRNFMVTEDPRQAVFLVDGRVEIAPPANGRQRAKVVWTVTTVSGGQVGRAIQENTIPAGSLNGAWGQVAAMVANAAADGVEELFGRPSTRRAQAVVPPPPLLPQVPGRAPPPPR